MKLDEIIKNKKPKYIKHADIAKALGLTRQGLFYHVQQSRKGVNSLSAEQMRIICDLFGIDLSIFFE